MGLFNWSQERKIEAACGCNKGLRRSNNEDNFYFDGEFMDIDNDGMGNVLTSTSFISDKTDEKGHFFAVFDGMGGGQYGEVASYTAAVTAREFFDEPDPICTLDVSVSLQELCADLNDAVFNESVDRDAAQMGSTLAGFYFFAGYAWCCNMGDSKCFRLRNGVIEQLSIDHTDAEVMKANGITGRKPYVTQYLGIDRDEMRISPQVTRSKMEDGDLYLICSDGLTDMVSPERITDILSISYDQEEQVQSLIVEALKNGGKDNITVMVCNIVAE